MIKRTLIKHGSHSSDYLFILKEDASETAAQIKKTYSCKNQILLLSCFGMMTAVLMIMKLKY